MGLPARPNDLVIESYPKADTPWTRGSRHGRCYSEWTMQRPVVVVGSGGGPCLQTRQEAEDLTFVYEMLKILKS